MLDEAAIFLRHAGQKAGDIDEGQERNIEAVAEADEARGLAAGIRIENARQYHRLVGDNAHRSPLHAPKADDDVSGESLLDLEEIALIDDFEDQFLDIVRLIGIARHKRVERFIGALAVIETGNRRRARGIRRRQEIDETPDLQERLYVVLKSLVGDRGLGRVDPGAA